MAIIGFVVACLAAGLTMALFVYSPLELVDLQSERLREVGLLSLAAGTQIAMFAAGFALIGAVFGEWQRIRGWMYYVLVAIAIAAVGFLVQFRAEAQGEASIVNNYAVTAFLLTGFVAGFVYWLLAGRSAGGCPPQPEISSPARPAVPPNGPSARVAT
jgi:drug/metabolite transporter (DMT)-like permease